VNLMIWPQLHHTLCYIISVYFLTTVFSRAHGKKCHHALLSHFDLYRDKLYIDLSQRRPLSSKQIAFLNLDLHPVTLHKSRQMRCLPPSSLYIRRRFRRSSTSGNCTLVKPIAAADDHCCIHRKGNLGQHHHWQCRESYTLSERSQSASYQQG
jgi:hypothetical protein